MRHPFIFAGSALPDRPNSRGRKYRAPTRQAPAPIEYRSPRAANDPNAIGRRMDFLGISAERMAALLACHHRIPVSSGQVRTWAIASGSSPRNPGEIAPALAIELDMNVADVLAAWEAN